MTCARKMVTLSPDEIDEDQPTLFRRGTTLEDEPACLWDLNSGECLSSFSVLDVASISLLPDGQAMLVGEGENTPLADPVNVDVLDTWEGAEVDQAGIVPARDAGVVITHSGEAFRLRDTSSGECTVRLPSGSLIHQLAISAAGDRAVAATMALNNLEHDIHSLHLGGTPRLDDEGQSDLPPVPPFVSQAADTETSFSSWEHLFADPIAVVFSEDERELAAYPRGDRGTPADEQPAFVVNIAKGTRQGDRVLGHER